MNENKKRMILLKNSTLKIRFLTISTGQKHGQITRVSSSLYQI